MLRPAADSHSSAFNGAQLILEKLQPLPWSQCATSLWFTTTKSAWFRLVLSRFTTRHCSQTVHFRRTLKLKAEKQSSCSESVSKRVSEGRYSRVNEGLGHPVRLFHQLCITNRSNVTSRLILAPIPFSPVRRAKLAGRSHVDLFVFANVSLVRRWQRTAPQTGRRVRRRRQSQPLLPPLLLPPPPSS